MNITHRYARHITLTEVGKAGQQKLKNAKVLCIGAGGLGSPALLYLAAAGVGSIGIVEDDVVELSNLQRQILFSNDEVGHKKSFAAKNKLVALNPEIIIKDINTRLTRENAFDIIAAYDVVLDCTDNFYSRYLISDTCVYLNKPNVYASILRFEGQCSVFSMPKGPCYRCLFPSPPLPEEIPSCTEAGVIGALPGILGSIQAMETIKIILNIGNNLAGRLLLIDALTMQFKELTIAKNPGCPACSGLFSLDQLHMPKPVCDSFEKELTIEELRTIQKQNNSVCVLDVREQDEYDSCNLGGKLIPINQLAERLDELEKNRLTIIICQTGKRSVTAAKLMIKHGFNNIYILKDGINSSL